MTNPGRRARRSSPEPFLPGRRPQRTPVFGGGGAVPVTAIAPEGRSTRGAAWNSLQDPEADILSMPPAGGVTPRTGQTDTSASAGGLTASGKGAQDQGCMGGAGSCTPNSRSRRGLVEQAAGPRRARWSRGRGGHSSGHAWTENSCGPHERYGCGNESTGVAVATNRWASLWRKISGRRCDDGAPRGFSVCRVPDRGRTPD